MELTLRGDYFDGSFTNQSGLNASDISKSSEKIEKFCPGDLSHKLWEAKINYANIEKVIESSVTGFESWRKLSFEERIGFLKKFQEEVTKRKEEIGTAIAL